MADSQSDEKHVTVNRTGGVNITGGNISGDVTGRDTATGENAADIVAAKLRAKQLEMEV